jgi:hypothetical protein
VKQPWARLICSGIKDIENRTWKCPQKYIGERVLIHASGSSGKKFKIQLTDEQMIAAFRSISNEALNGKFEFGAIIGSVEIVDCRVNHQSIWAEYTRGWPSDPKVIYHWVLANPILFEKPILNVKGRLRFWDFDLPEEYEKLLK